MSENNPLANNPSEANASEDILPPESFSTQSAAMKMYDAVVKDQVKNVENGKLAKLIQAVLLLVSIAVVQYIIPNKDIAALERGQGDLKKQLAAVEKEVLAVKGEVTAVKGNTGRVGTQLDALMLKLVPAVK